MKCQCFIQSSRWFEDNSIRQVRHGKFPFFVAYILTSCSIFLDCLDQELMIMIYDGQDSVKDMSCNQRYLELPQTISWEFTGIDYKDWLANLVEIYEIKLDWLFEWLLRETHLVTGTVPVGAPAPVLSCSCWSRATRTTTDTRHQPTRTTTFTPCKPASSRQPASLGTRLTG